MSVNSAYGGSFNEGGRFYWELVSYRAPVGIFRIWRHQKIFSRTEKTTRDCQVRPVMEILIITSAILLPMEFLRAVMQQNLLQLMMATYYFLEAANPLQDYGIYLMNEDGSSKELVLDHPGTTELSAQYVEKKEKLRLFC
ncbi:MAG: hypothetical protein IPL25_15660 [Saprospiraceae bacterium]|nr:hypothetical protein [Candidatus Vicinibacter affinis]